MFPNFIILLCIRNIIFQITTNQYHPGGSTTNTTTTQSSSILNSSTKNETSFNYFPRAKSITTDESSVIQQVFKLKRSEEKNSGIICSTGDLKALKCLTSSAQEINRKMSTTYVPSSYDYLGKFTL